MSGSAARTIAIRLTADNAEPTRRALSSPRETLRYGVGDLAVFSSYRLHRIEPFGGAADRVSLTVHGVEVDPGVWETWF